jgi:hypothetical protein
LLKSSNLFVGRVRLDLQKTFGVFENPKDGTPSTVEAFF